MSTVLWANVLQDGKVTSDQDDHLALYKHADKLDALTKVLQLPSFLGICDTTDLRFNTEDLELPEGMESTDELMAVRGAWMPVSDAVALLEALRKHIVDRKIRFGLLGNQHQDVVAELDAVLDFARAEAASPGRFNFSVVM